MKKEEHPLYWKNLNKGERILYVTAIILVILAIVFIVLGDLELMAIGLTIAYLLAAVALVIFAVLCKKRKSKELFLVAFLAAIVFFAKFIITLI